MEIVVFNGNSGNTTHIEDILWREEPADVPRITDDTKDRALRLKTLGNAVCPPQAYPIFHYIAAIETGACASICPYGGGDG